ncbi:MULTISPECIES: exodeoxyribonuclease V subunit alpha [Gammaproteobacteria]|uniref:exodeoxyribonuclease V subunit alpha n=1 Tax=Gammaproteobacteria TaxID=1236 RepID=UPI0014024E68|nr:MULTISPECIES: exodeoxyribonuclease V subunit alpha [Gammaproteobacteria]
MLKEELLDILHQWQEAGWIRALDRQLALLLLRENVSIPVALMAALVSHQIGRGHTCLSVKQLLENPTRTVDIPPSSWQPKLGEETPKGMEAFVDLLQQWRQEAPTSHAVREVSDSADKLQPLVWDASKQILYLRRYWQYENRIDHWLRERMNAQSPLEAESLQTILTRYMPGGDSPNWQRIACANAAKQGFSVITGGPGTGKTYTVVRVLATLEALHALKQAQEPQPDLRVALAAPTGKAAARMQESIDQALHEAGDSGLFAGVKNMLTRKASTLHRLLGAQRNSRYFRHGRDNPLPFDVVVVDEASMIDTEMFDALLQAIGKHTKLILLGDKDQLAPVEAGSVLASICRGAEKRAFSESHRAWLQQASAEVLGESHSTGKNDASRLDHVVMLDGSQRFTGAVAELANAVNEQSFERAKHAFEHADENLQLLSDNIASVELLVPQVIQNFKPFVQSYSQSAMQSFESCDQWAHSVLAAHTQYLLLTGLRNGPWGQRSLNTLITQKLGGKPDKWYHGRPVMVKSNDYSLNLNNGDIGVALQHPEEGRLKVAFPGKEKGTVRWVIPSRLTEVETVYAMTVHKSQGSEFTHAVLVVPDRSSPVLTKELLYTGITRAKPKLTVVIPNMNVWQEAIQTRIERLGGLT